MPYSALVWEHFLRPRHVGAWPASEAGVLSARADTPASDAVLQLQLRVMGDCIQEARFLAYGGVCAIAAGSWLAGRVTGSTLTSVSSGIDVTAISTALDLSPTQRYAGLLAEDVLQACLKSRNTPNNCFSNGAWLGAFRTPAETEVAS